MADRTSALRILSYPMPGEKIHSTGPLRARRDLLLPPLALDRRSGTPLCRQVAQAMARAIRAGVPRGTRLPSTRTLSRLLGVSRNTVLLAYDELVAEGLIAGRRGAAMIVVDPGNRPMPAFDPRRVLRDAQYPARTLELRDPDGTPLYLRY